MGTKATIGGFPILGAFAWRLANGVAPVQTVAELRPGDVETMLKGQARALDLEISTTGWLSWFWKRKKTFSGLFALQEAPGDNPRGPKRVLIADKRWIWPSFFYRRAFNITRKVGTKWLNGPNQIQPNATLVPTVAYAPWSLNGGTKPYTAEDMLNCLAEAIGQAEEQFQLRKSKVVISDAVKRVQGTPIQDVELDGPLDECIERALAYLPGVSVYVAANGDIVFYDTASNSENRYSEISEAVAGGHIIPTSFSRVRPSAIRVYFDVRAEVRFDFTETSGSTNEADARYADNVAPIPDPTLTVNGANLTTGAWAKLTDLYTAWGNTPGLGRALDTATVRKCMIPFLDSWSALVKAGLAVPDADWMARLATVQTHFRQTFQINRRWMDRIREFRAERVGTIDSVTGTRGKAPVYSDYAYLYSQRSQYLETSGDPGAYVVNVIGYPSDGTIDENTRAAAATLSVVDPDQGVVSIDFLADTFRVYEQALPSQVELEGDNTTPGTSPTSPGPSPTLGFSTRPIGFNLIGTSDKLPTLTGNDKKSFIVTCSPGSPNDKAALVYVEIKPTDEGVANFPGKDACVGPIMEIRINPSVDVARVPWTDANADRIQRFFTRQAGIGPVNVETIDDLVMNYGGTIQGGASMRGIAVGAASAVWTSLRDRRVGAASTAYSPGIEPTGSLSSVSHTIDAGTGAVMTNIALPDRVAPLNIDRYLPESVKRIIHRIVNPGS